MLRAKARLHCLLLPSVSLQTLNGLFAVHVLCPLPQDAQQGHLVEHLPKNIGFGMGLEFREGLNLLKAGNERKVQAGMVFNVAVGKCLFWSDQ